MGSGVFYCVLILLEVAVLASSQTTCITRLEFIPRAITIGKTSNLSVTCFGSSILRLLLDRNPIMFIQKLTSSGLVTMATLDGNDTVTKKVEGIEVVGFFPSKFEVTIQDPGCSDVTNYFCRVNVTNSSCMASRRRVGFVSQNVTRGPPLLTIMPSKPVYEDGDLIIFGCSASPRGQFFSWNWDHPLGKDFRGNVKTGRLVDALRTCNRTSFLSLTLKAEDNGTEVSCMSGSSREFKASIVVNVVARQGSTPSVAPTTKVMQILPDPGESCIPGYILALVSVATLILTLILYSVLLRMGGTKFKLPFKNCFVVKKGHLYEIPDREPESEADNSYCVIQSTGPIYVNSPRT